MRVLLTGGSGFLGRHLLKLWGQRGLALHAPDSTAWDLRNADRTQDVLRETKPELVVHLAAYTSVVGAEGLPQAVRAVNVSGTENLLAALSRHAPSARLVFTSTCHVYGPPRTLPVPESHPLAPVGTYALSKREAETRVQAWEGDAVIVRPFHLTGPGQPSSHAASDWARQAAAGAETIHCGDLSLRRDFLDVRDAVEGLWVAAHRAPRGSVLNLCSGRSVPLADVLKTVAPGCRPFTSADRLRQHDVPDLRGDPTALQGLGWRPRIPLRASLLALREAWNERG